MDWRERLRALERALDARARRERLLLAAAVAVVLLLAWDVLVRAPLSDRIAAAEQRIEQLEREAGALDATGEDLERRLQEGGGGNATVAVLREQIRRVDAALAERTARVISPRQMVAVLRDMLEQAPGLKLMALRNRGSEPIITEPRAESEGVPRVFRHRVEVVLRGEYFAVQAYLQRLEGLEWRFQWDGLALETVDYPVAEATLSISTLSLAEDWIGV